MEENTNEIKLRDILLYIRDYFNYIFIKRYYILLCVLSFMILGLYFNFNSDAKYKAELKFVVDDKSSAGLSSMSSLASDFGINFGSSNGNIFNQNNIIELLKSRGVIIKTLMRKSKIEGKTDVLIEHYLRINNVRDNWEDLSFLNDFSFRNKRTFLHDSISGVIWNQIIDKDLIVNLENKDASIITLTYSSKSQEFAKKFVEKLINEMSKMYIAHETSQANNTLNFLQNRADSVFSELLVKEKEYAKVKDVNQRIIKSSGRLKEFQLQRSVQVLNTMYLEITKNLELSKLTLLNQTPNINILDKPVLPLKDNKISIFLMLIISGVLGFITSISYFLIQKLIRNTLNS